MATPETYLGTYRAAAYTQQLHPGEDWDYGAARGSAPNTVALAGHWTVESHQIVAGAGAHLLLPLRRAAHLPGGGAAGSRGGHARRLGRRRAAAAGARARRRPLPARRTCRRAGPHLLDLSVPAGTTLYSFTFG